jgi:hypothetical protein
VFLVKDASEGREQRIRQFLNDDPSLAALLSIIHVEWTVRRAVIALGQSPNVVVRQKLERCHGCDAYKDIWKLEVVTNGHKTLPNVVANWHGLTKAFKLRHMLVHGASSCSGEYATERMEWALLAAQDIREYCSQYEINLDTRLPVRRQVKVKVNG